MPTLIEEINLPEESATILDRLKYLVKISHKTQAQFARLINIDPSSMSKILADKMPITEQFVNRVVVNLNVSKAWFASGTGVPFGKNEPHNAPNLGDTTVTVCHKPAGAPVYDIDATAGVTPLSRQFTAENIMGYIDMPQLDSKNPIIRVSGDSMEPRVANGAFISIRPINDPSVIMWGSIYLVQLEDYRMVKIIKPCHDDPDKVILHSENPAYDDIVVKRDAILKLFFVEAVLNCQFLS